MYVNATFNLTVNFLKILFNLKILNDVTFDKIILI